MQFSSNDAINNTMLAILCFLATIYGIGLYRALDRLDDIRSDHAEMIERLETINDEVHLFTDRFPTTE